MSKRDDAILDKAAGALLATTATPTARIERIRERIEKLTDIAGAAQELAPHVCCRADYECDCPYCRAAHILRTAPTLPALRFMLAQLDMLTGPFGKPLCDDEAGRAYARGWTDANERTLAALETALEEMG